MTIENLEKELKNGVLQSIYLFYGEELYLLESCVKKIKTLFGETVKGINYVTIDETNLTSIISEMETPAFGYEKKLILVKNSGLLKKDGKRKNVELSNLRDKINEYIKKNVDTIKQSIILVIIEDEIGKNDLISTIEKNGVSVKFEFQKPMQIEARIKAICNGYKVNIDSNTIRYFIECCGTNMQELINEIRKLIEHAGAEGTIKKEDIDKLSIKKLESVIFELTDNLGKKQIKQALDVMNNLIYQKEPIQKILITLYNHFKKLYFVTLALNTNRDVTEVLNLKPNQAFLVGKYKTQARYFKEEELKTILQKLIDLDFEYKIGQIDIQIGLESILCTYCS
ncbi:MAG: DNA polymerase III subunit delta [Clostridia bacterium]|nr:DNA polymerase III subunit delta [Clostridia bacterium]